MVKVQKEVQRLSVQCITPWWLFVAARLGYLMGVTKETATKPASPLKPRPGPGTLSSPGLILTVGAVLVIITVAAESFTALSVAVLDGGVSFIVLAGAALAGGWLAPVVGLGRAPWPERLIVGAGLGTGGLCLLVLGLGSAGWLNRPVAMVVVGLVGAVGVARLVLDVQRHQVAGQRSSGVASMGSNSAMPIAPTGLSAGPADAVGPSCGPANWLWLIVCPAVAVAVLAACQPPGVLWAEEGYGYDVLEYHLAVPKVFFEQGRICFLSNNVYSNFPLNSEMLSLLMMVLRGDAIEAAFMAQLVNVFFAGLFAAAAWLAGSAFSPRAGLVAGIAALTAPWTAYLAGIAYVEVGMLAMGMTAVAVVLHADARPQELGVRGLVSGLLAGLAAGFKYTAVPLIAVPAAILLLLSRCLPRKRLLGLAVFAGGLLITFLPWMTRNAVNTGNPVFPLAYSVFGAKPHVWDADLEARWQKAHGREGIAEAASPVTLRLAGRTILDFRMGGVLVFLALAGLATVRDRWSIALGLILAWQLVFWVAATHQYARFAVVMLIPFTLLAGRSFQSGLTRRPIFLGLLLVGTTWNLYRLGALYYDHTRVETDAGVVCLDTHGRANWFVTGDWPGARLLKGVNGRPPGTTVLLIGEARTFYVTSPCEYATVFNRQPLGDAVRDQPGPGAIMDWLRRRGTRYVLVHWAEMDRLKNTYGFDPDVDVALFERLVGAGLRVTEEFMPLDGTRPYATLYEVPRHE